MAINVYQKGNIFSRMTGKQRKDITHEKKVGGGITTETVEYERDKRILSVAGC